MFCDIHGFCCRIRIGNISQVVPLDCHMVVGNEGIKYLLGTSDRFQLPASLQCFIAKLPLHSVTTSPCLLTMKRNKEKP